MLLNIGYNQFIDIKKTKVIAQVGDIKYKNVTFVVRLPALGVYNFKDARVVAAEYWIPRGYTAEDLALIADVPVLLHFVWDGEGNLRDAVSQMNLSLSESFSLIVHLPRGYADLLSVIDLCQSPYISVCGGDLLFLQGITYGCVSRFLSLRPASLHNSQGFSCLYNKSYLFEYELFPVESSNSSKSVGSSAGFVDPTDGDAVVSVSAEKPSVKGGRSLSPSDSYAKEVLSLSECF